MTPIRAIFALAWIVAAMLGLALCTSCAAYQKFASGYDRSYSVTYGDAEGRDIKAGVTLHPLGYSK